MTMIVEGAGNTNSEYCTVLVQIHLLQGHENALSSFLMWLISSSLFFRWFDSSRPLFSQVGLCVLV